MSAKQRRLCFSAPLVVTLAVGPGCLVSTTRAPQQGATPPSTQAASADPGLPPGPMLNPPRPVTPDDDDRDAPLEDQDSPPTAEAYELRRWTVSVASDKTCSTQRVVTCPPKATCNPPPPVKLDKCPDNMPAPKSKKSVHISELKLDECVVEYPSPDCPAGAICNPPRPKTINCPE